jgi:hypothetical protein
MMVGPNLKHLQIDIRLIEAIKQHQTVDPRLIQLFRHMSHIAEKRTYLHSHGNADDRFDGFYDIDVRLFDFGRSAIEFRWNRINVEFNRIGARLLYFFA